MEKLVYSVTVIAAVMLYARGVASDNPKGVDPAEGAKLAQAYLDGVGVQSIDTCNSYDGQQNLIYTQSADCPLCSISCMYDISPYDPFDSLLSQYPCTDCYCYYYQMDTGPLVYYANLCGTGQGDPHFLGFDGTLFDFQGLHDAFFNLFSDPEHQVNMHLDNLGFDGSTFLKTIGVKYGSDVRILVAVAAKSVNNTAYGTLNVEVNGESVDLDGPSAQVAIGNGVEMKVAHPFLGSYLLTLETPALTIRLSKKQPTALHLDVSVAFNRDAGSAMPHGVLGQTLAWRRNGALKMIEGDEADYLVSDIWADDFKFNQFAGRENVLPLISLRNMQSMREFPIMAATTHALFR